MLVLTRKTHESIRIGDHITITVLTSKDGRVQIGIDAPRQLRVLREELQETEFPLNSATTKSNLRGAPRRALNPTAPARAVSVR